MSTAEQCCLGEALAFRLDSGSEGCDPCRGMQLQLHVDCDIDTYPSSTAKQHV